MARAYNRGMGLRISKLRVAAGLSQILLAEKAGISRSQLSEIETEAKPANTRRLAAIAKALGVTVDQLFEPNAADDYLIELRGLMSDMLDEDRQTIIRMAQAFARRG